MNTEGAFRFGFWALVGLMFLMRIWFAVRVLRAGERFLPDKAAIRREGWRIFGIRLFGFFMIVGLVVLLVRHPTWWRELDFPLPFWLRWAAFALGLASLGLWTWTHLALGKLWSAQLQLRADHRLVTSGPYSRIRHPMYTAVLGWAASIGFLAANWAAVVLLACAVAIILARIPREEEMMIGQFGDEYRDYLKKTGRLLPKF